MSKFIIQKRNNSTSEIWYTPRGFDSLAKSGTLEGDSISELRETIKTYADTTNWQWWEHIRIITTSGNPVERYKNQARHYEED